MSQVKRKKTKSSITKRLFLNILVIVLFFSFVVLLANTLLLRPLNAYFTRQSLEKSFVSIMEVDFSDHESVWKPEIIDLERQNSFEILVFKDRRLFYSSSNQPRWLQDMAGMRQKKLFWERIKNEAYDDYDIDELVRDAQSKGLGKNLIFKYGEKDGYEVLVTQILTPVNNTIRQANIMLLLVTSLFLLIVLLVAFKLSKGFTKPIKKIQSTVSEISNLNFTEKCTVSTGDELEHLADDINILSDKLKSSLGQLQLQNEQLEKDIISQRKFISNASHELRTPLALIKGYADEIESGFIKDKAQQNVYIKIINEEATKMSRLLKEMLDLSRMESGRMDLKAQTLSVKDQICDFIEKYDGYILDNELDISLDFSEENHMGVFDAMRFEQILANYLSNAAKYCDEKRKVRISTQVFENKIRISLFNTGKHIPEEMLEHIWDRFYKKSLGSTEDEGSYGLGLSIVAAIQNLSAQLFGAKNVAGGVEFWFDVEKAAKV